jgi:glycosyltransferase involved in cell wall biosynthesis
MQAMLVGLPCVTTHVGSIAELAIHESTALVVPPEDAAALRAALNTLLQDRILAEKLGAAARRHCEARFGYETMLDRMAKVYQEAANAHR